jgi:hypothetical protein
MENNLYKKNKGIPKSLIKAAYPHTSLPEILKL